MIEVRTTHRVLSVYLSGEIDVASAPALSAALATATSGHWTLVVVDCSRLRFIDIAGARPIATARDAAMKRGMDFAIVEPSAAIVRVLDLFDLCDAVAPADNTLATRAHHRLSAVPTPPRAISLSPSTVV